MAYLGNNTTLYAVVRVYTNNANYSDYSDIKSDVCLYVDQNDANDLLDILQEEANWMCSKGGPVVKYTVEPRNVRGGQKPQNGWYNGSLAEAYYNK